MMYAALFLLLFPLGISCTPASTSSTPTSEGAQLYTIPSQNGDEVGSSTQRMVNPLYQQNGEGSNLVVGETIIGAPIAVGGTQATTDRRNRAVDDLLRYDFCGNNNSQLTSAEQDTVAAIQAYIKKNLHLTDCAAQVTQALQQLTTLDLSNQNLSNFNPIRGMKAITTLDLSGNNVGRLSCTEEMSHLSVLTASNANIIDISTLYLNTQLTKLYLSNNAIQTVTALTALPNLTLLDLQNNQLGSILPLTTRTGHTKLTILIAGNPNVITTIATTGLNPQPDPTDCGDIFTCFVSGFGGREK
jgi:Leucine-rich repeat (LRR) protein